LVRQPLKVKEKSPMAAGLEIETKMGLQEEGLEAGALQLGPPSLFTCPDCHGVLLQIQNGKLLRFRCHTGHAFSPLSLVAALTETTEDALWNVLRALEENTLLLEHLAQRAEEMQQVEQAALLRQQERRAREQTDLVRQATLRHETVRTGGVEEDLTNNE